MKGKLVWLTFILLMSFVNAFSDIRVIAPNSPTPNRQPEKETKSQGLCYAPTVVAGTLLSLAIVSFGYRFIRKRLRTEQRIKAFNH